MKKLLMVNDMTNTNDQIMLVKHFGKIVKDQELLRSMDLLLQMLELAGHGDEQVISATSKLQDPQQVPEGLAAICTDPEVQALVNLSRRSAW